MKRVNDEPYYPDFSDGKPCKIPVSAPRMAKLLGFIATDDPEPSKAEQWALRRGREKSSLSPIGRRPHLGRPPESPNDSFRAFMIANAEMRIFRKKFGVTRVPAVETNKFIAFALRLLPAAKEEIVREHIRMSQKRHPGIDESKV